MISFGARKRGGQEIILKGDHQVIKHYLVATSLEDLLVQEGDYVKAGTPFSSGVISPATILNVLGYKALEEYMINQIQAVYRLQGVSINDKHLEVIISQMLRKVEVISSGDTLLVPGKLIDKKKFKIVNEALQHKKVVTSQGATNLQVGELVDFHVAKEANRKAMAEQKTMADLRDPIRAIAKLKLQGITQATLTSNSFLSAASFQETVKVLSKAAIEGRTDYLENIKESVILGGLIPAGTGFKQQDAPIFRELGEVN